jgi:hypothetical protein
MDGLEGVIRRRHCHRTVGEGESEGEGEGEGEVVSACYELVMPKLLSIHAIYLSIYPSIYLERAAVQLPIP